MINRYAIKNYLLNDVKLQVRVLILIFSLSSFRSFAQIEKEDEQVEKRIENLATSTDENTDFSEIAEALTYYKSHPIDLNNSNREELLESGLMNEIQVTALLDHISRTGKLIALEELQTIDEFDDGTIENLLAYIKINSESPLLSTSIGTILSDGQNEIIVRTQRILEKQKGFEKLTDVNGPYPNYLGDPYKYYFRYRFSYRRNVSFSVTAEKDAGEQFFDSTQKKGFDFYSAQLTVRDVGIFKTICIGDYSLQYGQGLTLWNGLAFGKSPDVLNIKKSGWGIKPYTSVNEASFKRGIAVSIGKKYFSADIFSSIRKLDANISAVDTLDNIEEISSFQESGYHRTINELADKNSLEEKFIGGHLQYRNSALNIGITGYHSKFDAPLVKTQELYNQYEFTGDEMSAVGIDYSYLYRNLNFFGEVSRSDNSSIATINGLLTSLGPSIALSVVNRYYPRDYQNLNANALRESSNNFNEQGTYFGILTRPLNKFTLSGYFDMFTFPWLRYQVNGPSSGYEYVWQLIYTPSKTIEAYIRGKHTTKPANTDLSEDYAIDFLVPVKQDNYRFNISYKISRAVTMHSRVEYLTLDKEGSDNENGFLIYQDINVKPMGFPLSFNLRYALFDTKSYNSRIYAYENDVLYYYSIPSFYYRGSRFYINVRYRIVKGIDCWLRYAQTVYSNQKTIGSGLDEIDGNSKSEVKLQFRFQF